MPEAKALSSSRPASPGLLVAVGNVAGASLCRPHRPQAPLPFRCSRQAAPAPRHGRARRGETRTDPDPLVVRGRYAAGLRTRPPRLFAVSRSCAAATVTASEHRSSPQRPAAHPRSSPAVVGVDGGIARSRREETHELRHDGPRRHCWTGPRSATRRGCGHGWLRHRDAAANSFCQEIRKPSASA